MAEVREDAVITVDRPAAEVLAVLHDIANQHRWWPGQYRSEPVEFDEQGRVTRALIGNDVKVAKDEFEVVYSHLPGTQGYTWVLAEPSTVQRAQSGSWEVTAQGPDTSAVRLELMVDSTLPLPGFLIRKTVRDTVKGATKGLREHCQG